MNQFYGNQSFDRVFDYLKHLPELVGKYQVTKPAQKYNNSHGAIDFMRIDKQEHLPLQPSLAFLYPKQEGVPDGFYAATQPYGEVTKQFDDNHKSMWALYTVKDHITLKFYTPEELVAWLLL